MSDDDQAPTADVTSSSHQTGGAIDLEIAELPLDLKYGHIRVETVPGSPFEPGELVFLFRARDKNIVPALEHYLNICNVTGSPPSHLAEIMSAKQRIELWQEQHPDLVRIPGSSHDDVA